MDSSFSNILEDQRTLRLIEFVRKKPCLWKKKYKNFDFYKKEKIWQTAAKNCGFKCGKQARLEWRKLRNRHREAVRRRRQQNCQTQKPWRYEELMKFLLNSDKDTSEDNKEDAEMDTITSTLDETLETKDPDVFIPEKLQMFQSYMKEENENLNITGDINLRTENFRNYFDNEQNSNSKKDALSMLFESLCEKTRKLPKSLQLRVERDVFNVVTKAEEEALSALAVS